MTRLKVRTREQQFLVVPFAAGILAGLGALVYLFLIPADPRNSLLLGFSLARLMEALGLLVGVAVLSYLLWQIMADPDAANRLLNRLEWYSDTPWSLAVCWIVLMAGLLAAVFLTAVFPAQEAVFDRLIPFVVFSETFSLFFVAVNLLTASRDRMGWKVLFLIKVSLITVALGLMAGLAVFPAQVGLLIRQGSLLALLLISPLVYFSFSRRDVWGGVAGFLCVAVLFGGAIAGVWASGTSDLNIIAGLLPYNDANGYYHGARLLSEGQLFHPFSAKRPVFPAFLGLLYTLGGQNLQLAIGGLVLLAMLAVFFSAHEVNRTCGAVCAAFFVFGVFLFLRRFIGSVMSETLGLPLGVIGFGLLWSGAYRRRAMDIFGGLFMLTLGLIARAGPFFMLPFLVLWAGWLFRDNRRFNWKIAGFAILAVALGYAVHLTIYKALAGTESSSMGNFSYTFYGLAAGGKGWKQYAVDHPDVLALIEPAQSQAIYRYAFETIKADPSGILRGALVYWKAFFTFDWSGMFGYIEGATALETLIGRIVMALLTVIGLIAAIIDFRKPVNAMLLAGWLGILLSIPFVPTLDAEIRTYAAAIPWFVALAMTGLWAILIRLRVVSIDPRGGAALDGAPIGFTIFAVVTALLVFAGPLIVHSLVKPAAIPDVSRCQGESRRIVTTLSRGSYLNVREDAAMRQSMVPDVRYSDFNKSMHDSPVYSVALQMFPVQAGDSFFYGYDRLGKRFENILGKTQLFEANQGLVELCGWREEDPTEYGFFHVESIHPLQK